jgi:hypothetical protein
LTHRPTLDAARTKPGPGRPRKFGRPSRVVALTLPEDVIQTLQKREPDLAWAIVSLVDRGAPPARGSERRPDAELVTIAGRRSLIVVDREIFRDLPGVNAIPLTDGRALLALEPGRGLSDLELTVLDRLDDAALSQGQRQALTGFRAQLKSWRRDATLRFHTRAIIVVERAAPGGSGRGRRNRLHSAR